MKASNELLKSLNEDLAAEWGTITRYTYQSAKALGLRGAELREIFQKEIPDELRHASYLTDVISDFGGEPTTQPRAWDRTTDLKTMVEQDLKLELHDVDNYKRHAKMAEEEGLIELKVRLEEMASDESRHARELNRILRGLEPTRESSFEGKENYGQNIEHHEHQQTHTRRNRPARLRHFRGTRPSARTRD